MFSMIRSILQRFYGCNLHRKNKNAQNQSLVSDFIHSLNQRYHITSNFLLENNPKMLWISGIFSQQFSDNFRRVVHSKDEIRQVDVMDVKVVLVVLTSWFLRRRVCGLEFLQAGRLNINMGWEKEKIVNKVKLVKKMKNKN
jgi:hypothetical protein